MTFAFCLSGHLRWSADGIRVAGAAGAARRQAGRVACDAPAVAGRRAGRVHPGYRLPPQRGQVDTYQVRHCNSCFLSSSFKQNNDISTLTLTLISDL